MKSEDIYTQFQTSQMKRMNRLFGG